MAQSPDEEPEGPVGQVGHVIDSYWKSLPAAVRKLVYPLISTLIVISATYIYKIAHKAPGQLKLVAEFVFATLAIMLIFNFLIYAQMQKEHAKQLVIAKSEISPELDIHARELAHTEVKTLDSRLDEIGRSTRDIMDIVRSLDSMNSPESNKSNDSLPDGGEVEDEHKSKENTLSNDEKKQSSDRIQLENPESKSNDLTVEITSTVTPPVDTRPIKKAKRVTKSDEILAGGALFGAILGGLIHTPQPSLGMLAGSIIGLGIGWIVRTAVVKQANKEVREIRNEYDQQETLVTGSADELTDDKNRIRLPEEVVEEDSDIVIVSK